MSDDKMALRVEHELLGASFAGDGLAAPVIDYGDAGAETAALAGVGSGLCDLTGLFVQLVEDAASTDFVRMAYGGPRVRAGDASFGAVLSGDGGIVSVPLVARTGASEHVIVDGSVRADVLAAWLGFLVGVEQGGLAPFAGVHLTDATDVHVPLALIGVAAQAVLIDYVGDATELPMPGCVRHVALDGRIGCVCLNAPLADASLGPCYLLLVSPSHVRVLWRSLLSFQGVTPVGRSALKAWLARALPWFSRLDATTDRLDVAEADLRRWGLLREGADFVGARAILGRMG